MKLNVPFPAGIKDFMCELCGKTFSERNTMETHKLIHTGMWGAPGDRPASQPAAVVSAGAVWVCGVWRAWL